MAECSDYTTVFDYQVEACKTFFKDELPGGEFNLIAEEDRPDNMKRFAGPIVDITGFEAYEVVAVLSDIVNNKCPYYPWENNKTFYMWIHSSSENNPEEDFEELFRLKAGRPFEDQPGNGIVFLRPRGRKTFSRSAKNYDELNGALKAHYETDTASFAKDIKELFKNNAQINDFPQATFEAYMMLLFEIARRLVTTEDPSKRKEELDVLPIGSAIASFVKLLELGEANTCLFEDVFFRKGKFHCFTGEPEERRQAIDNINMAVLEDNTKSKTVSSKSCTLSHTHRTQSTQSGSWELPQGFSTASVPRHTGLRQGSYRQLKDPQLTKEHHLKELQELFCPKQRLADFEEEEEERRLAEMYFSEENWLVQEFKGLNTRIDRQRPSWSYAEYTTAYDHCELRKTCSCGIANFICSCGVEDKSFFFDNFSW